MRTFEGFNCTDLHCIFNRKCFYCHNLRNTSSHRWLGGCYSSFLLWHGEKFLQCGPLKIAAKIERTRYTDITFTTLLLLQFNTIIVIYHFWSPHYSQSSSLSWSSSSSNTCMDIDINIINNYNSSTTRSLSSGKIIFVLLLSLQMLDKRQSVDLPGPSFSNSLGEHQWLHMASTQPLPKFEGEICIIG